MIITPTSIKLRINGPVTKPNFNGLGILDLSELSERNIRHQVGAAFQYVMFLDLHGLPKDFENEPEYWNLAIRSDQNDSDRIDEMRSHFDKNGFMMDFQLPCVGTDGKIRDGRTRIIAANRNGERWIPVSVYEYTDLSELAYITNGLIANDHPPASRAKMNDFIEAGAKLCLSGELIPETEHVDTWLYDTVKITNFFENQKSGNVTKIRKGIINRYINQMNGKNHLVRINTSAGWKNWCITNNIISADSNAVFVNTDQTTSIAIGFTSVLTEYEKTGMPVEIIFFSNSKDAKKIVSDHKRTIKTFEKFYLQSCYMHRLIPHPTERPFKVLGAPPQIVGRHDMQSKSLLPIDQY